jgi:hypothetical protein
LQLSLQVDSPGTFGYTLVPQDDMKTIDRAGWCSGNTLRSCYGSERWVWWSALLFPIGEVQGSILVTEVFSWLMFALDLRSPFRNIYGGTLRIVLTLRGCIRKFPDWPPGARTANDTALCH